MVCTRKIPLSETMGIQFCTKGINNHLHCHLGPITTATNEVLWQGNTRKSGGEIGDASQDWCLHFSNTTRKIRTHLHPSPHGNSGKKEGPNTESQPTSDLRGGRHPLHRLWKNWPYKRRMSISIKRGIQNPTPHWLKGSTHRNGRMANRLFSKKRENETYERRSLAKHKHTKDG